MNTVYDKLKQIIREEVDLIIQENDVASAAEEAKKAEQLAMDKKSDAEKNTDVIAKLTLGLDAERLSQIAFDKMKSLMDAKIKASKDTHDEIDFKLTQAKEEQKAALAKGEVPGQPQEKL